MRKPDPSEIADSMGGEGEPKDEGADDEYAPESDLEAAVADLCDALDSKDYKAGAAALEHAFMIMESKPHKEAGESEPEELMLGK